MPTRCFPQSPQAHGVGSRRHLSLMRKGREEAGQKIRRVQEDHMWKSARVLSLRKHQEDTKTLQPMDPIIAVVMNKHQYLKAPS